MNERMRELEKQSVYYNEEEETWEFDRTKFAQLIVRECGYYADVFESLGCPVDMDPTETKPSDYIKKHFGVEE